MYLSTAAQPVSVARLLVTHGYPLPTATRTMQQRHLTSHLLTVTMPRSLLSRSLCSYTPLNHLNIHTLNTCRTYSDDVTSSESEGTSSSDEDEWTSLLDRVARASLSFVDKHGWSWEAIQAGVNSLGLPGVAHGVMGNGGHDLLKYFEQQCNDELAKYLETELQPLLFNEEPDKRYEYIHLADELWLIQDISHTIFVYCVIEWCLY